MTRVQVSVVIPVFNKAAYLAACLESVLQETEVGLEVICIDDASSDASPEVLRDFARRDTRIRVLENARNLGPARSRNRGIEAARGDFLRFVDADDLLTAGSNARLHARATGDGVDAVRGSIAQFQGVDSHIHLDRDLVTSKRCLGFRDLPELWIPWWHTSYLIATDLVMRHDLRYPDLTRGEDPVFLASVLVNARAISLVEDLVYLYRKYLKPDGSAGTAIENIHDHLEHAARVRQMYVDYHLPCWDEAYGPFLSAQMERLLARCEFSAEQQSAIEERMQEIWGTAS